MILLFRLLFGFWFEMLDPSFSLVTDLNRNLSGSVSKRFRLACNIILSCVTLINCQKPGYPTCWEFSHIQLFCKNEMHYFLRNPYSTSFASLCNSSVTHNHIMDFNDYFWSCQGKRPFRMGSTSRLSLPCLNSATLLFYGSIWSDILSQCCYNNSMNSLLLQ